MAFTVPKTYDPGDMVTLSAQFYKKDGTVGDPTTVVLKIRNPLGVQSPHVPDHDVAGSGLYTFDYQTSLGDPEGRYEYRFEGAGAVTSAEEKAFYLNPSDFS